MDRKKGIISNWNEEKGFGFITPESGGKSIFFHINDYSRRHKRPLKKLKIQYLISKDLKGRLCATDVAPIKGHKNNGREIRQKIFSLCLFITFLGAIYYMFELKIIPIELVCLYQIMSVVTFLMYAKDKNAAERGKWRTSESTLHTLSLFGGWPGARIAQSFLRHKSKKKSFRFTYWVTVIVNCGALYWLVTPEGSKWLQSILIQIDFG